MLKLLRCVDHEHSSGYIIVLVFWDV